jgi:methylenetetrahydrofolate--tRNA-(uracil-5-)-methyltransferase
VEGYLESAATGLLVGVTLAQRLEGRVPVPVPFSTALGALTRHVSGHSELDYSPMNVTFGLFDDADVPPIRDKAKRREEICRRALAAAGAWRRAALGAPGGMPEGPAEEPGR